VTETDDGTFSVYVEVEPQPPAPSSHWRGYPGSTHEHLTLGPGVPSGSTSTVQLLVVDVTTSA
jgi:hypothetical protein